ncbi:MAG: cytochrome P460 family protein [Burkholderiales bacterium]|nr:cytochrome P460 family protein [Burkholderiales bacterium]
MKRLVLACAIAAAPMAAALAADPQAVPYPEGYRNWVHVKTMVINPGHPLYEAFGGMHHVYANAKAMEGYRGGRFPDGAVIVFDLLEAKTADNAVVEGPRKVVGVMHKDGKRWKDTGGWGFEGFKGDSKGDRAVGKNAASACFECHTKQRDRDFVFSAWRP